MTVILSVKTDLQDRKPEIEYNGVAGCLNLHLLLAFTGHGRQLDHMSQASLYLGAVTGPSSGQWDVSRKDGYNFHAMNL